MCKVQKLHSAKWQTIHETIELKKPQQHTNSLCLLCILFYFCFRSTPLKVVKPEYSDVVYARQTHAMYQRVQMKETDLALCRFFRSHNS